MKLYALLIASAILFAGCVSTPKRVNKEYLKDMSDEQVEKIESIELQIITITDEKVKVSKAISKTKNTVKITKGDISVLKSKIDAFEDKETLYTESKDNEKLAETKKELKKLRADLKMQKLKLEYFEAKEDNQDETIELKEIALSTKISDQYYEEAKIARANQDKALGPVAEGEEDKNRIPVTEYEEYHKNQKDKLKSQAKDQRKSVRIQKKAETKLKANGYTGEL